MSALLNLTPAHRWIAAGLTASGTLAVVYWAMSWLHSAERADGLHTSPHEAVFIAAATLLITAALGVLMRWAVGMLSPAGTAQQSVDRMPPQQAAEELRQVAPYLEVLAQQLDGSVQDT